MDRSRETKRSKGRFALGKGEVIAELFVYTTHMASPKKPTVQKRAMNKPRGFSLGGGWGSWYSDRFWREHPRPGRQLKVPNQGISWMPPKAWCHHSDKIFISWGWGGDQRMCFGVRGI